MLTSGSVYVWSEDSQIMRWTDGIQWGPSRTLDNFRLYHSKNNYGHDPAIDSRKTFAEHNPANVLDSPLSDIAASLKRERIILDSLPDSYNYKVDKLIKKVRAAPYGLPIY